MLNIMIAAIQFVTIDPGHFHAALVQNRTYEGVSPDVLVYAPEGADLKSHLALIDQFNTRESNPTAWKENVYTGDDFLKKFIADAAKRSSAENASKIVILAGRNNVKPDYYLAAVEAGLNVLSDKPMAITAMDYMKLCDAAAVVVVLLILKLIFKENYLQWFIISLLFTFLFPTTMHSKKLKQLNVDRKG